MFGKGVEMVLRLAALSRHDRHFAIVFPVRVQTSMICRCIFHEVAATLMAPAVGEISRLVKQLDGSMADENLLKCLAELEKIIRD